MVTSSGREKSMLRSPASISLPLAAASRHLLIGGIGVHRLRSVALQPEDHGLVRAVAVTGGAERPEQLRLDPLHVIQQAGVAQTVGEQAGSAHRPHGVRRRGADADREHVQGAQCHETGFAVGAIREAPGLELSHRVEEPATQEVGERRSRQDPIRLVGDLPQHDRHRSDQRQVRGADLEGARVQVQRAALLQHRPRRRSGQLERGSVGRQVDHRTRLIPERFDQPRRQLSRLLVGDHEELVG